MRTTRLLAPFLLLTLMGNSRCPGHSFFVQSYGYTELRPPSTLLKPGTLVTVENWQPFEARVVCGAEASLGPNVRFMRSATTSGSLKKLNNRSFAIDATTVSALKERQQFRAVDSITVTLNNAHIVELSDDDVLAGIPYRSQACIEAVRNRVIRGYTITMISSALMGDVTYSIGWDYSQINRTDMADKSMAMLDLAVALEGEITSTAAGEIRAKGLVWGVRDDEYLSALSIDGIDQNNFARGTRHIPVEHVATLDDDDKVALIKRD